METLATLNVEGIKPTNMTQLLTNKYQAILGEVVVGNKDSIDKTVEHIVNYYESIIASMPGNVYWLDKNCVCLGCNKNVLDMFNFTSLDEFKGLTFEEMGKIGKWSPEATASFKKDTLDVIHSGKAKLNIEEPPIPHANGEMIWFLTSRVPLFDHTGIVIGIVGISINITERKKMEIELALAKEQAEVSDKLKTEFIRNMEHDIRTPLSGVWGLAQLFAEKETDILKKECLEDIAQCSKELLDYCNIILDFSKIESGTLPIFKKKFSIKKLIDGIMAIECPPAKMKNITLTLKYDNEIPPILIGDEYRLQRILINLVSNAIKFTKKGTVTLASQLIHKENSRVIVRFTIQDTGIGIAKEKQEFIYEKFSRINASNKNSYKGMGLGLRIVKQFMEEMEGEIDLISDQAKGTTFTCTLPLNVPLVSDLLEDNNEQH